MSHAAIAKQAIKKMLDNVIFLQDNLNEYGKCEYVPTEKFEECTHRFRDHTEWYYHARAEIGTEEYETVRCMGPFISISEMLEPGAAPFNWKSAWLKAEPRYAKYWCQAFFGHLVEARKILEDESLNKKLVEGFENRDHGGEAEEKLKKMRMEERKKYAEAKAAWKKKRKESKK